MAVGLFRGFVAGDDRKLRPYFQVQKFPARRAVAVYGDMSSSLYLVANGYAEVRLGSERIAGLGPGDSFGELGVLGDSASSAHVVALSELTVYELSAASYDALCAKDPGLAIRLSRNLIRLLGDKLRMADDVVQDLRRKVAAAAPPPGPDDVDDDEAGGTSNSGEHAAALVRILKDSNFQTDDSLYGRRNEREGRE